MRIFGVAIACVVLLACGTKPPPQFTPAAVASAEPVDAGPGPDASVDLAPSASAEADAGADDDDDDDDGQLPACKQAKAGCKALAPKKGSITMERTACYGHCPIYSVTIAVDGTVTWHGEHFVDATGDRTSHADAKKVAELFAMIGRSCYASFKGQYTSNVTDHPWANLTLKADGQTKVVKHYLAVIPEDNPKRTCGAIDKLLRIEQKIDEVAGTRKLIGNGSKKNYNDP